MKKIISCLMVFLMILGFVSCSSSSDLEGEKEGQQDLSALSAEEFYDYACEKTLSQGKVKWETTLTLPDGEEKKIESIRIKEGYDGFSYSRTGFEEDLWFDSSVAYVRSALGAFSSPLSSRVFQEYLDTKLFPTGLVSDLTESTEKTKQGVAYTLKKDAVASFALSLPQGDFIPEGVSGRAEINEKGIVLREEITVKGTFGQETCEYRLKTESVTPQEEEKISLPENITFAEVGDIRIPFRIVEGVEALAQKSREEITLLVTGALSGENPLSYYEETVLTAGENGEYYLRGQDLKKQAGKADEATYFSALRKGNTALENRYDLMKKEMISEGALSTSGYDLSLLLAEKLPGLSGLKNVELVEELKQDTVTFSLTDAAVKEIWQEFLSLFPDAAISHEISDAEATGLYTFSSEGDVVAFSLALNATVSGQKFFYQVSLTPRSISDPQLPDALSLPEYIDPSHGGSDGR